MAATYAASPGANGEHMFNRLTNDSAVSSFIKFAAMAAAVALIAHDTPGPTRDHRNLLFVWIAIGVASPVGVLIHSRMKANRLGEAVVLGIIAGADFAALFAALCLTNAVSGPFWVVTIINTIAAAVIVPNQALAVGVALAYGGSLVGATAIAHDLSRATAGPLVVIGLSFPLVALLGNAVASRLETQRTHADAERDQLRATVEELSAALAQAARGDLSVGVSADSLSEELLSRLAHAFDNTLGNLRGLVTQIRSGGEHIVTSAHELLASAEEHAASATQQSSAVSETTATIEELAATAAQIAETSESVARYAAETLRHAEDGREAVSASVDAMDTIAQRVEQIGDRALSLGEKGQEIGRILDVINDLADQTNLLALNAAIEAARAGENGRG
ncbi:MAG TPA: methyl-accepting chemotaxis protein, partial [Mycobacteriales bacterium]|nr:methyl-accepting chemotaxis protein [Mycobacteriales bacterium]